MRMLGSVWLYFGVALLNLLSVTAHSQTQEYWSSATKSLTEASGQSIYSDFQKQIEFEQRFIVSPSSLFSGQQSPVPYKPINQPHRFADALSEYGALAQFVEAQTAQKLGVFVDPLINSFAMGYDSSSRDNLKATVATEIGYEGTKFVATSFMTAVTGGAAVGLAGKVISQRGNMVESGVKTWIASSLLNNVIKPETLARFESTINKPAMTTYSAALSTQLDKVVKYQNSLDSFEKRFGPQSQTGRPSDSVDVRKKQKLMADLRSQTRPEQLTRRAVEGQYGIIKKGDEADQLIEDVKDFVAGAQNVIAAANKAAILFDAVGVDLSEDTKKVIGTASKISNATSQLASGNYLGAAMGIIGIFGSKQPDPQALRFQALMGALNQINGKLVIVLDNQKKLMQGQARILNKLDQLHWSMNTGFQNLEASLQENTETILRAIFSVDDRNLGSCKIAASSVSPTMFPESAPALNIFEEPNSFGLPEHVKARWSATPPTINEKLSYFLSRNKHNLVRCHRALTQLLNGIPSGRGLDEYFYLSRFDRIALDIAGLDISDNEKAKIRKEVENPVRFAKDFRVKVFGKQHRYYMAGMQRELQNLGYSGKKALDATVLLAFRPAKTVSPGWVENNYDFTKNWSERSRITDSQDDDISRFEKYFGGLVMSEFSKAISAPTTAFVANAVVDLHSIFGMLGPDPNETSIKTALIPKIEYEEDALRLLLNVLQIVEIYRAQQSVVDGTSLLEILWSDFVSGDLKRWNAAHEILQGNSLVRKNFVRYLFYRSLTHLKSESVSGYQWALSSGNKKYLDRYLRDVFAENMDFTLHCNRTVENNSDECSAIEGNLFQTSYEVTFKFSGIGDLNTAPKITLQVPGFQTLRARKLAFSPAGRQMQLVHDRLRKAIASYRIDNEIDIILGKNQQVQKRNILALYRYASNVENGHISPRPAQP